LSLQEGVIKGRPAASFFVVTPKWFYHPLFVTPATFEPGSRST